jgi:hypothetical protein
MRFAPKLSHISPLLPPPSCRRIGGSRVDSPHGGGALTYTNAIGAILEAEGPPKAATTCPAKLPQHHWPPVDRFRHCR